ncbi:hypothetical protein BJ741DRAFT_672044 [Chytriomyces cf. hyalinus JEL632]|nr:hypothetical protein BJ741DRAFT_672044 [Chytriomyces cf. hyalinus JEL632]
MWIFNHDPAIAVLVAVVYFVAMDRLMQSHINKATRTGVVTPTTATLLSGRSGPAVVKSYAQTQKEAATFQKQVTQTTEADRSVQFQPRPITQEYQAPIVPQQQVLVPQPQPASQQRADPTAQPTPVTKSDPEPYSEDIDDLLYPVE